MKRLNFLKNAIITACAVLILFSCKKNKEPEELCCDCADVLCNDCADELYYYYSDDPGGLFTDDPVFEKIFITDHFDLLNDWLIVGFESHVKVEEIVNFINQTDLFKPVDASIKYDDYRNIAFVNTKKPKTCTQLKEIIQSLEKSSMVTYAHLTFDTDFYGGEGDIRFDIMSFTNDVIVMLNNIDDLPLLESITSETKTQIIKQSIHYPEQFTIAVDKNSQGNAMQMANYFHETEKFKWASPNFYYAKIGR